MKMSNPRIFHQGDKFNRVFDLILRIANKIIKHCDVEYSYEIIGRLIEGSYPLVLDIGSGTGEKISSFRSLFFDVICLDISTKNAKLVKKRGMEALVGDAQYLPFRSSSFDLVTCFHAVEHLKSPTQAFGQIYRVLRKNGFALVVTPNRKRIASMLISPLMRLSSFNVKYPQNPDHIFEFTNIDLMCILRKTNFANFSVIPLFLGLKVGKYVETTQLSLPRFLERYCDQWAILAVK